MGLATVAKPLPASVIAACIATPVVAGFLLAGLIRATDQRSIVSVRRLFGLFFASTLIWIVPLVLGLAVSALTGLHAATNEFVFGAFLVWGFECVVINGAFLKRTLTSLVAAAAHPFSLLVIATSAGGYPVAYPMLTGVVATVLIVALLLRLEKLKTRHEVPSLRILQAFLKTWVAHEPEDLERYFSSYARDEPVTTDVVLTENEGQKLAFILPGVHPGPFYPVGSYNLSELIYRAVKKAGVDPVVLHGTGGHEKNTPTNEVAGRYASEISQFISSLRISGKYLLRGPVHDKVGATSITTLAWGNNLLSIISNSPFLSDDLDPAAISEASNAASRMGLAVSLVDAHNSVDGERRPQSRISGEEWESIFRKVLTLPERPFRMGLASSTAVDLKLGSDVSEGGISVVLFETEGTKSALVSADSNNAVSILRQRVADELGKSGVELVELCTSDTHNFAARNMVDRGYYALGEASGVDTVVDAVKKLAEAAETEVSPCELTVARFETVTRLVGSESLEDFAELTRRAISLAKSHVKVAIPAILLLAAITLF